MVNNCFGNLPDALLAIADVEILLDQLTDYLWEESPLFSVYPQNKQGNTTLDLYPASQFSHMQNRQQVEQWIKHRSGYQHKISEYNTSSIKGFYIYYGVEGSYQGEDYPVGYRGKTQMGDYFRFLIPTIYGSITDFPQELRHGIAVSDTVDFNHDQLFANHKINDFFPEMHREKP